MKLSRELWLEAEPLLAAGLEMPAAARPAWLDALEATRPDAVAAVRRLLEAHERAERSRELETVPRLAPLAGWTSSHAPGARIGPFELLRPLGHGGMGEVWLARQADGRVEREVALKLPALHQSGETWRERFRRERDILARLVHPNIARLYDAGVTEAGQPWLAMEFVEGHALSGYVTSHSLTIPQRLALFRQVLAAVLHAHRHLVVHRDLKPPNILIDGSGQVKLLDFGIAKLVDASEDAEGSGDLTRLGGRVMTLRYAAPEQVAAGAITTATDIYSLGVVLHEVLTGLAPYRAVREGKALTESMLLQEEIAVPSALAVPKALARVLAGDLDAILLKAMRRDPAARYASVELFDQDLLAHLDRRPVKARTGTWRYLAGRFAVRNKFPLAMTSAIIATLAVGLVMVDQQRRVAVAERERAERHFNSVRQLANSLIFDVHDQIEDLSGATKAKQTLVENASKYLARLAPEAGDDPGFRREMAAAYLRLGNIQGQYGGQNIGKPQEALVSFDRAIVLLAPAARAGQPGYSASSADDIVQAYRQKSQLLFSLDRLEESIAAAREGLSVAQALAASPGATDEQRLSHARMLVEYTRRQSRLGDANIRLRGLEEALAITESVRRSLAADAPGELRYRTLEDIAWMSSEMGHFLRSSDDPAVKRKALEKFRVALEIRQAAAQVNPAESPVRRSIAVHHTYIGLTLSDLGDYAEALESLDKATTAMRALLAADPGNVQYQRDVFLTLTALATVQVKAGRYGDALACVQRAQAHQETLPDSVRSTSENMEAAAELLLAEGEAQVRWSTARNPPGDIKARLVRSRRALQAADRIYSAVDAIDGVVRGARPEQARLHRLLREVDTALARLA